MADAPDVYQCPLCRRQPYPTFWEMCGCAFRDLANATKPGTLGAGVLAARPVERGNTRAVVRRPTTADLTVYALVAFLELRSTVTGLQAVADTATGAVVEGAQDRDQLRRWLLANDVDIAALETALADETSTRGTAVSKLAELLGNEAGYRRDADTALGARIDNVQLTPGTPGQPRYVGEGPPPATLPGATDGDYYLDRVSGDLYQLGS